MISKIKKFVLSKHFLIKSITEAGFSHDNDIEFKENLNTQFENFNFLAKSLNIQFESAKDLLSEDYHYDKLISSYINSIVHNNNIDKNILELYGKEISEYYHALTDILSVNYILSFLVNKEEIDIKTERGSFLNSEFKKGEEYINNYFKNFRKINFVIRKYFSTRELKTYVDLYSQNIENKNDYQSLNEISSNLLNRVFPEYDEVAYNLRISKELIEKLNKCKVGLKDWNLYEKTCIEILRFLFIPEFSLLYFQNRTQNGHQIRDVIIPNTKQKGFWKSIKEEFNSKNIIIELKNGASKNLNKDSVNQLRIYLSKKTIGKFGLLFIRNQPSKSLLISRKLAYEESGILILIIDDKLLKNLILSKAWLGSCKEMIQREKIKFEMEY
jgi:hypothetical protein